MGLAAVVGRPRYKVWGIFISLSVPTRAIRGYRSWKNCGEPAMPPATDWSDRPA
jgi:hypothetical protein